ncbi:hypothetical protein Tco_0998942 [Tanacetum coccineum]
MDFTWTTKGSESITARDLQLATEPRCFALGSTSLLIRAMRKRRLKEQQVRVLNLFGGCYSSTAKDSSSYCQHIAVNTAGLIVSTAIVLCTASFIRHGTTDAFGSRIELEMITSQLQGKLWLYDEVQFFKLVDKDEDFRRSPYNDKDTEDTEDILKCLKDIICSYLLIDSNEKKLIQMIKIHTDKNVADFLTKSFDKGIRVNAGDSKLMLLGINLLLQGKVNAARHYLLLLVATVKVKTVNGEQQLQALVDGKKIIITKATIRRDIQLEDADATNEKFNFSKYIFESMVKNLDNAVKFLMKQKSRRPKEDTEIPQSSVLSDPTNVVDEAINEEPSMQLKELMNFFSKLQQRVLDLENIKTTQAQEITSLKKRVKKLEKKGGSRTHKLKRLYRVGRSARVVSSKEESLGDQEDASKQGRIDDIDADKDIYLVNVHRDKDMFRVNNLEGDEEVVESKVADKDVNLSVDEVTLAQALAALKSAKVQEKGIATTIIAVSSRPRAKGIVFHEQEQEQEQAPTPIVSSQQPTQVKDKGKGKMVKEEPMKKMSKKELLKLDEELAFKLQAEEDEEERLAREKAQKVEEANIAWDDIQAKVKADYQLAQRLQAQEQEELSDAEKATLFVQLLEKRRKHFAAKRAEEKRNRPPTKAQQRSFMCTYLKNMEGWKPKDLKNKSFANIQDLFDKAMKRVNTFVDMDTELVKESSKKAEAEIAQESSSKRAGEALEQESSKKQKVDDDKETEELKQCMEIISDDGDDVTIEATPLSTKSPTIVDYKIYKEGKKSYFQIIRADGNSQMYLTFGKMLKNFDREDLEVLWSIVKARFKKTEPVNYMDTFLHLNLKTMFEHHLEDNVWKNQQGLVKVLNWKLYDSCGVHCVTMQNILYYLLVEKMYPLTKHTLHQMFNDVKLQVDYECEMAFELLRLVKKQLKEGYVPQ